MRCALLLAAVAACGEAAPVVLCTATSSLTRHSSEMSERGLPLETWEWDSGGLATRTAFAYDDAGRIVAQRLDFRADPSASSIEEDRPDGRADAVIATAYSADRAEVTFTDLDTRQSRRLGDYTFDAAGRPLHVDRVLSDSRRQIASFQYDEDGRVLVVDATYQGPTPPHEERHEYTYGADGRPAAVRSTVDGALAVWTFRYEDAPGSAVVRPLQGGFEGSVHRYEHDALGRLTLAEEGNGAPEHTYEIAYGDDGAVAVLRRSGEVFTYSAGCGVAFEVPRAPRAPTGPHPDGYYRLPDLPTPF